MKQNQDTNLTADPKTYMKQVQTYLKDFNAYIISKHASSNAVDKSAEIKKILGRTDIDQDTKISLIETFLAK